jgi:bifunctional non-homologous end joining protein LigD
MIVRRPSGFIEPCQPSKAARPPSGPLWVHEIKHDGYRLMVRRDGARVRCFTRNGHDWADRFPAIVEAALRQACVDGLLHHGGAIMILAPRIMPGELEKLPPHLSESSVGPSKATSFPIDGEAVIARDDGTPDFRALRSKRRGHEAMLFAFDIIEHDGDDLRDLPLIERKRRLARLLGRAKRRSIQLVEHLAGDGPTVFEGWKASCRSGRTRPIEAGLARCGSSRRTRRARRCAASARNSGTNR